MPELVRASAVEFLERLLRLRDKRQGAPFILDAAAHQRSSACHRRCVLAFATIARPDIAGRLERAFFIGRRLTNRRKRRAAH